ncbi:hypothetical protein GXB84_06775 [Stenotrophomonas acidaminiphila]|uniref:COG3904 family protein n=1 Tax=Stenotrophomonas acidaminiphila TaxID=128780 RepID=UPI0013754C50|nr:hypothetical protein [Stenotrophomonas acidaminiphila]NCT87033.1 hypothetical protein [Stenotrophomonas acidaminiphila]
MSLRIISLAFLAMLTGCNAPSPPPPPVAAPQPPQALPEPVSEPDPAPAEEPTSVAQTPKAYTDDPTVVAWLEKLTAERDALGTKVFQAGVAIDGHTHAGTAFNEIHIPEHKCFVLGHLLGKADLVKPLGINYEPDYDTQTTENASDLRIMAVSLDNFASVAKHILSMSHDERVVTWNLDCAGQLDLPKVYIQQEGQSSFYVVTNEGRALKVLGDIEEGFAQKIRDAIEANPTVEVVALGSGGGYVHEAMAAGAYIRSKGLDTTLFNNCYSACPLVFMAGVERQNWSPYPKLGFHQIYTSDGQAIPLDSEPYRQIFGYLMRMGIEPRYVLQKMWSAPPEGMTNVDGEDDDLCRASITTWIQRGCSNRDYGRR